MSSPHALPTAEEVFHAYAPRVYSLALRMLGNTADAEDVTQEVLLQVVRKLATFRGDSSLATWLHRVTVNAALALRRKRAGRREVQAGDAPEPEEKAAGPRRAAPQPPERLALSEELRRRLEAAMAGLPPAYR